MKTTIKRTNAVEVEANIRFWNASNVQPNIRHGNFSFYVVKTHTDIDRHRPPYAHSAAASACVRKLIRINTHDKLRLNYSFTSIIPVGAKIFHIIKLDYLMVDFFIVMRLVLVKVMSVTLSLSRKPT